MRQHLRGGESAGRQVGGEGLADLRIKGFGLPLPLVLHEEGEGAGADGRRVQRRLVNAALGADVGPDPLHSGAPIRGGGAFSPREPPRGPRPMTGISEVFSITFSI